MNCAAWRQVFSVLLSLICLVTYAAETERPPGFKRAVTSSAISESAEPTQPSQPIVHQVLDSYVRQTLGAGNFFDLGNPDLRHLQRYEDAVANLPMDKNGFPDWMRALRESTIKPRAGLLPNAAMNVLNLDVVMKNTKEMPFVRFPHYSHTLWLDCSNCHPVPFEPQAGSNPIRMSDIFRGQYCGVCHDRVAFITFFSCQRCHNVPQPGGIALPN